MFWSTPIRRCCWRVRSGANSAGCCEHAEGDLWTRRGPQAGGGAPRSRPTAVATTRGPDRGAGARRPRGVRWRRLHLRRTRRGSGGDRARAVPGAAAADRRTGRAHAPASGDRQACQRWLPGIADGSLTATVAGFPQAAHVTAERGAGGWVLRGEADFVLDGEGAESDPVAAASLLHGTRLFACQPDHGTGTGIGAGTGTGAARTGTRTGTGPGVGSGTCERVARRVLDPTRRQALVRFRHARRAGR